MSSADADSRVGALQVLSRCAWGIRECRNMAEFRGCGRAAYDVRLANWSFRRAVPALRRAAQDGDERERVEACRALCDSGVELEETLRLLIGMLQDPSDHVREETLSCFQSLGERAASAVPALLAALRAEEGHLRCAVVSALGRVGVNDPATVEPLVELLSDSDPEVRRHAVAALRRRRPLGASDIRRLLCAPQDETALVYDRTDGALKYTHSDPAQLLLICLSLLREDSSPTVRARAAVLLGELGARDAVAALELALYDEAEEVREATLRALEKLR